MKIRNKISLSFFTAGLILVGTVMTIFYIIAENSLRQSVYKNLDNVISSRASHIETYLGHLKIFVGQLSKSEVLANLLRIKDKVSPEYAEALEVVFRRLDRTKAANPLIAEFLLMDRTGLVVASSNKDHIGMDKSMDSDFLEGRKRDYIKDIYISEVYGEPLIMVSAPILDYKTNELLGVVAGKVRLDKINDIVSEDIGIRRAGEIFIVNKYGYMITPSKFKKDVIFKQYIDISNTGQDRLGFDKIFRLFKDERIGIFYNYIGMRVLRAHHRIYQMQWTIVAEIDSKIVFRPLFKLRLVFFTILFLVPLLAWFLGIGIAKTITRPLYTLYKGTQIIGSGNLDYKVGTDADDEVGQLSRAFDEMSEYLKNTTTSIENLNREIFERRKAEIALQESEENYRALFMESKDAIMTVTPGEGFLSGNPEAVRMFACKDEEEFISKSPSELSPEYQPDGVLSSEKAAQMMGLALENGSNYFEWTHKRLDGAEFPATVLLSRVAIKDKIILQATVRDITERKKAEQILNKAYKQLKDLQNSLIQSEKMSAIGRFSVRIAHEVKNPLGIILGGIEFIESKKGCLNEEARDTLDMIKNATIRANTILTTLLHYARPSDLTMEKVKPEEVIEPVINMIKAKADLANIVIDKIFDPDVKVSVNKNQFEQALLNIAMNAIEAITKGGKISFRVYKKMEPQLTREKISCVIEVSDTGVGISKANRIKLTEPFYTTKESGVGTGLGLFITKMIVDSHKGKLLIDSVEGKGTTVEIILPVI